MATSNKQEYLVILPDKPDHLEARMKVRAQHLAEVGPRTPKTNRVVLGGATLDEPLQEGTGPKINGSVMIYEADSEADVKKWIEEDVYFKTGVWDPTQIKIIPFKSAVRESL